MLRCIEVFNASFYFLIHNRPVLIMLDVKLEVLIDVMFAFVPRNAEVAVTLEAVMDPVKVPPVLSNFVGNPKYE